MTHTIGAAILFFVIFANPAALLAQARGAQPPQQPPQQQAQPQRGQRPAPKPPAPMTLRQVIESLSSLKNTSRVEDLVSKAGVQFQATPGVLEILKEFG